MKEPTRPSRMAESWNPPPELSGAMPRPVELTQAGKVNQVLFYVSLIGGLAVVLGILGNVVVGHRLAEEGVEIDGSVTRTWTETGRSRRYEVAYEFTAGGKTIRGESEIPHRKWQTLSVGSHLAVRYVPSDPSINRAAIGFEQLIPYWVMAPVLAFWFMFLSLGFFPMRKAKRLLQYGQPAPGLVVNNPSGRRPKYGYVIKYEVQLPEGPTVTGATQRDASYSHGESVCVLYDPKRPRRNDIYPLKMVRLRDEAFRR